MVRLGVRQLDESVDRPLLDIWLIFWTTDPKCTEYRLILDLRVHRFLLTDEMILSVV